MLGALKMIVLVVTEYAVNPLNCFCVTLIPIKLHGVFYN